MTVATRSLVDAALDYAARGWPVIPLHHIAAGRCSCSRDDCSSPGKHPRTRHGLHDGTTEAGAIRAWWRRWPEANVGLVTGPAAGLVVVDVDPAKGGEESLAALEAEHGELPATLRSVTGGAGMHIFLAHPGVAMPNSAERKLGPGLDSRGDGGYVVAPPSGHLSGRHYAWVDLSVSPAPMPTWLLDLLRAPTAGHHPSMPPASVPRFAAGGSAYGLRALEAELAELGHATEGSRNHRLNAASFTLSQLVAGGELDEGLVVAELTRVALAIGLTAGETERTISSGAAKGRTQPRSAPARDGTPLFFARNGNHTRGVTPVAPPPDEAPPLDDEEWYDTAESPAPHDGRLRGGSGAAGGPPGDDDAPMGPNGYRQSDRGNARRLVDLHGRDLRYCAALGSWLAWDGRRWAVDESGEVYRRAKSAVAAILDELRLVDAEARKGLFRFVLASEGQGRIEAMVRSAQTEPEMPVPHRALDADPWAFNCGNGTVDLRTGKLRPHRREDLITKLAPVDYDPEAPAPVFEAFLGQIMDGDEELVGFLQRAIGYSLTGCTTEQSLFFLHGGGSNGKSTLLGTLLDLVGDYGVTTEPDLLLARRTEVHPTGMADLFGVRLALAEEVEAGRRFDEGTVKRLTGGEKVRARRMRQDFFEFPPTHKLWLAANHKPVVRGTDHAIWRRLRMIPFAVTIEDKDQDKALPAKLAAEGPGILAWAVRGCLAWQREGLRPPEVVATATADYRREMDVLGQFLADCCDLGPEEMVAAAALFKAYGEWAKANNEFAHSQKIFGSLLTERGFRRQQVGRLKVWTWYGLSTRPIAAHDLGLVSNPLFGAATGRAVENAETRPIAAHRGPISGLPPRVGAHGALTHNTGRDGPHGPRSVDVVDEGVKEGVKDTDWEYYDGVVGNCTGCGGPAMSRSPGGLILHPDCQPGREF